jgi:hypothetical protein
MVRSLIENGDSFSPSISLSFVFFFLHYLPSLLFFFLSLVDQSIKTMNMKRKMKITGPTVGYMCALNIPNILWRWMKVILVSGISATNRPKNMALSLNLCNAT